jgi:hypothetical protein
MTPIRFKFYFYGTGETRKGLHDPNKDGCWVLEYLDTSQYIEEWKPVPIIDENDEELK